MNSKSLLKAMAYCVVLCVSAYTSRLNKVTDRNPDDVISKMNFEEKAGEMKRITLDDIGMDSRVLSDNSPFALDHTPVGNVTAYYSKSISFQTTNKQAFPSAPTIEPTGQIQKITTTRTPFKIQVLYGNVATHLPACAVNFPQQLAIAGHTGSNRSFSRLFELKGSNKEGKC